MYQKVPKNEVFETHTDTLVLNFFSIGSKINAKNNKTINCKSNKITNYIK
jgi:hypothetical protein